MSDAPAMVPAPGDCLLRWVGDRLRVELRLPGGRPHGWTARLRTNLGRARQARDETIATLGGSRGFAGVSWRDVEMRADGDGWALELPLTEVGWFRAKAYALDREGRQHWPGGHDLGISVHPDAYRTGNTIYCAFARMFGASRGQASTRHPLSDEVVAALDRQGYTVIPPSGRLRDLTAQVPHIVERLGCRILHLLPVGPTPTTYARFGRFGSPYACLDLTGIDPALVEFDRRTTAIDQFRELAYAVHLRGARLFLDLAINHTGWGSRLLDAHPEWFKRNADGTFHSPGAWGTTWEDLVELEQSSSRLWEELAEAFLTWCRRGVDGFRCDAGYMVPLQAWQYITARVRQEFPDTVFLLEGLGGAWEATAALLTEGGMQWAYSELFQNYQGPEVSTYLDHALAQGDRLGLLVHYSETHDNERLAKGGRAWSLLRNRLCALASSSGAFGFTAGVEWQAAEKLEVHQARGLNWGAEPNLVDELGRLNRLLADDPCFFDGARVRRLSPPGSPLLMLHRLPPPDAAGGDGPDEGVLVLVNLDPEKRQQAALPAQLYHDLGAPAHDLLGQDAPAIIPGPDGFTVTIGPGESFCLAPAHRTAAMAGGAYRRARAQAAWAVQALAQVVPTEKIGPCPWRSLSALVDADPAAFLAAVARLDHQAAAGDLAGALAAAGAAGDWPQVVELGPLDLSRVVPVPPGHWLLLRDRVPFAATLSGQAWGQAQRAASIPAGDGHVACFPPAPRPGAAELLLESYADQGRQSTCSLLHLDPEPGFTARPGPDSCALLTNGRGGMMRLGIDLGSIASKYDCLLGANLHPDSPSDRHVLAKRIRAWIKADGFITPLNRDNLADFKPGPPARWTFVANAGDGRTVPIELVADLLDGRNTALLAWSRPSDPPAWGSALPAGSAVSVILRIDCEDRGFHQETVCTAEADAHFLAHTSHERHGFSFTPAADRRLRVWTDHGSYHTGPEWCRGIPHPVEASRGMTGQGDAWSPGWFELPLDPGGHALVTACADPADPAGGDLRHAMQGRIRATVKSVARAKLAGTDAFGSRLATAAQAYLARRGDGLTVIAGYPWFLDWGRDTFIAARGLLAAGLDAEVVRLLATFARFEERGTLPNLLNGDHATNRDTSDAPLWYALAAEEAAARGGDGVYAAASGGRTVAEALRGIAAGYLAGTPNGIRVDPASGLVWSPPHFTWMDTNYPACTPREGYPIEIQALWIRLCRQLARLGVADAGEPWQALADRALASVRELFWLDRLGWWADALLVGGQAPVAAARADESLRPNQLFLVSLGLDQGPRARRAVAACARFLAVPGALRTLAPLPVDPPLEIRAADGRLLADPLRPYRGRYEGDEDGSRKPAYHNGTAWPWLWPTFCEAVALAWDGAPHARAAARAYLGAAEHLLNTGCCGHLPEIIDGDAPHRQRGCDAQAWSVTEALRVWKCLH